jgi:hypothetical protein
LDACCWGVCFFQRTAYTDGLQCGLLFAGTNAASNCNRQAANLSSHFSSSPQLRNNPLDRVCSCRD